MTNELVSQVQQHYDQLSPGQRTVAEHLIREPRSLAFSTAADIGRAVGVSESTVIRLAHTLGYRGFADLQEQAQGWLSPRLMPDFVTRAATTFPEGSGVMGRVLEENMLLLRQTIERNRSELFEQAIEILSRAQGIFVTGARSSYGVAHFFWYTLRLQRGNATFLEADTPPFLADLAAMGSDSALVAVSYPRYSEATINIARYAQQCGCPVIGITDDPLSALGRLATASLVTPTESVAATMSFAPVVAVMTSLLTGIALHRKGDVDRRLQHVEEVQARWKRISLGS